MPRHQPKLLPSQEELKRVFDYDPQTGSIAYRSRVPISAADKAWNARYSGKPAGGIGPGRKGNQYLTLCIAGSYYRAHRIIWKIVTGDEPPEFIDHEDGNNFNTRWKNLRPATNGKNLQNAKLRCDNSSGVKGVCFDATYPGRKKWKAVIRTDGKTAHIGRFETLEEAETAIDIARIRLHGEFARKS